jgi:hypothetical protein
MSLDNEIKRIKSLFTEERLYGNLINEDCADCDDCNQNDMAKYLNQNGYYVKKSDNNTVIDNEGCKNGDFYNNVWNNIKNIAQNKGLGSVEIYKDGAYGCAISIGYKSNTNTDPFYINLSLWDDGDYIMTKTYYDPFSVRIGNEDHKLTKLYVKGKWEWQTDHIEFRGDVEKVKKLYYNIGDNSVDKIKSKKYHPTKKALKQEISYDFDKFDALVDHNN